MSYFWVTYNIINCENIVDRKSLECGERVEKYEE